LTLNQWVTGSNPVRETIILNTYILIYVSVFLFIRITKSISLSFVFNK